MTFHGVAVCFGFVAACAGFGAAAAQTVPIEGRTSAAVSKPGSDSATARNPVSYERGNPLWPLSITALSATRERPIFLPSRRSPRPAVASPPPPLPVKLPPPMPGEPDRPKLALIGAVVGTTEAIAVFVEESTRNIVRLKTGEAHAGWILRSVKAREVILHKERQTVMLVFPVSPDKQTAAPQNVLPGLAQPTGAPGVLPGLAAPSRRVITSSPPPTLPSVVPTTAGRLPGL